MKPKISVNLLIKSLIVYLVILFFTSTACRKVFETPVIQTDPVTKIARTSAWFKGSILINGSDSLVEDGFCWSTGANPTILEHYGLTNHKDEEDNLILYNIHLSPGTRYYVRTYIKTINGAIYYGNEVSFSTKSATVSTAFNSALNYGTLEDIDGNIYRSIQIGNQEWMAENLRTTRLNDGSMIPVVEDDDSWSGMLTAGRCWFENNEAIFRNMYGAYYNWFAVNTGLLCPTGWHVPSEEDWKIFKISLGMTEEQAVQPFGFAGTTEGNKIKESGTNNWVEESMATENESGFTALPGGVRSVGPSDFLWEGTGGSWWSSSSPGENVAWSHHVVYDDSRISRSDMYSKSYGLNVRCIKDK